MGIVSPFGSDLEEFWKKLERGESAGDLITAFDTSNFSTRIGCEVKDFDFDEFVPKKEARRMGRFLVFALTAAKLALRHSGLNLENENRERVGAVIGSGIGGMKMIQDQTKVLFEEGPDKISPFFIPMAIINMAPGKTAIDNGIQGFNISVVSACATSAHSIGIAADQIRLGRADVMLAGGTEASITPIGGAGFCNMKALSTRNDDPKHASRPFDLDRDGFLIGEGAGVLILEDWDHAMKRGAEIHAELVGFGGSADAFHIAMPDPEGKGPSIAMKMALNEARINPEELEYINAHGTSTPKGDIAETVAIKNVFKDHAYKLAVSSSKSMFGHGLGAAGVLESVVCIETLKRGILTPTINYEKPDPECDLDYVPNTPREKKILYAMNNSFGFGGQNAVLIFKKV
ncbi:MAG: beta-ketoacyl-ACP synthase II [Chloroflexi bacterium]|nr:beta-ketoacyl-ACP synthase II [Chloroflexota bacterium]